MNVFNLIAGAGGVSEGLYIWKKSNYTAEQIVESPRFVATYDGQKGFTIKDANFDWTGLPEYTPVAQNYLISTESDFLWKFFKDYWTCETGGGSPIKNFESYTYSTSVNWRGVSLRYYNNSWTTTQVATVTNYGFTVYANLTNVPSGDYVFVSSEAKTIPAKIGDFIDYVISDKEDAYPDGAEQGGFYYERFTPFDLAKDLNCTKYVTGSFTPTGNSVFKAITHNFGTYAKFAVSWYAGWKVVPSTSAISTCFNIYADNGRGAESFVSGSSGQNINANANVNTTSTTVCEIGNGSGGSKYYYSGREYHYIVFG